MTGRFSVSLAIDPRFGPWPCSTNSMYRRTRTGVVLTENALTWKHTVRELVWAAWHHADWVLRRAINEAPGLRCWLSWYLPGRREDCKWDVDNPVKPTIDAIAAGMGFDDRRIDDSRSVRYWPGYQDSGSLTILVEPFDGMEVEA